MINSEALKKLFLYNTSDQPISYSEFKSIGASDQWYIEYCNYCEAIRSACIVYHRSCTKKGYGKLRTYCTEIIRKTILDLKEWLEASMDVSFEIELTEDTLRWLPESCRYLHSYDRWCILFPDTVTALAELVYLSSEDFRLRIEQFVSYVFIGEKNIGFARSKYVDPKKPSKKDKRESCEFYTITNCLLSGEKCDKAYCTEYIKDGGLPLKRLPTDSNTVDFGDTVSVSSANEPSFSIVIPEYKNQLTMKPIEKALIHKKVGATVIAGATKYRICSVEKAPSQPKHTHKPVCLLSDWQKAERKLLKLKEELVNLPMPCKPQNLGDSSALTKWAKDFAAYTNEEEDLDNKITELEELLDM